MVVTARAASSIDQEFLRREDAAAYVGLSVSTLAALAGQGKGPRFNRVGRACLYSRSDLNEWVRSNGVAATLTVAK